MIAASILWILAISYATADERQDVLPTFTWDSEPGSMNLIIDFNDGGHPDVAHLERTYSQFGDDEKDEEDDECILTGYLADESDVAITVDGCPGHDTFQVIFNSKRIPNSAFEIHNGQVTAIHLDPHQMSGSDDDENIVILEDRDLPERFRNTGDREITERSLPSSFKVTLALAYDNLFLNNVCGGDHAKAKTRVEKIISLAQTYFLYSATLGTKITLVVKEIKHTNHELKLRNSGVTCDTGCQINKAGTDIASKNPLDVDNYHFFSADNPGPGVMDTAGVAKGAGMAGWTVTGSVCIPYKSYRVGITEFWGDPTKWESGKLTAALTFAHELGHSLGMPHDFLGGVTTNPRKDSSGTSCLNVDGIMSYKNTKTTWSTCSKESISTWFNQLASTGWNCKKDSGDSGGAAVNCKWGTWQTGACTKSCGTGTRTNTRTKEVVEANGGTCSGQASVTENCNTNACPSVGACTDTDNGAKDTFGDGCNLYVTAWCGGFWDDADFNSKKMCCKCGGGKTG